MASDFSGSPRLLKGALVVFEAFVPVPTNLIAFQYNPDQVTRQLQQPKGGGGGGAPDPCRNAGDTRRVMPPTESFKMAVELDATDQLEDVNPLAVATGIHPTLAALELLVYPPSTQIILGKVLAKLGSARVSPAKAPLVLLVWGPLRVIPVQIDSMSVTEQAFDTLLNPIRAKVDLGLRTLTEKELKDAGPPFDTLALVNQIAKEVLARTAPVTSVSQIGGALKLF
ncbi:MAG TPA: hypothetical protein VFR32_07270 [Gaiellaceae bacterium]|nr:hypothetical protein [Gaiellaceae bacterium]